MRKILFLVLIFLLVINLFGCGSKMTDEEYKNFEVEIQSSMDKVMTFVETILYNSEILDKKEQKMNAINRHLESVSEDIVKQVEEVRAFIPISKQSIFNDNYSNIEKDLQDLKWDSTTDINQYEEKAEVVLSRWESVLNNNEPITLEMELEKYMKRNNISYTWKDIQYDMLNKLNQKFLVVGTAKLSDYYNYGFRDKEKDYFVVTITPYDGDYSNRWYLYFHRESYEDLFNDLKNGDISIIATCKIPEYIYKDGQGNMAFVDRVTW